MILPPPEVLAAYGLEGAHVEPITIGLINHTFRVDAGHTRVALQRLHPAFRGEVNLDLDAITTHLAARGLPTPRLVRTRDGRPYVTLAALRGGDGDDAPDDDRPWRALTWLEGLVRQVSDDPAAFRSAGALVARFHRALHGFEHDFAFTRPGAHDTDAHLARLADAIEAHRGHRRYHAIAPLAAEILAHPRPPLGPLPRRIIHGDLKLSNVLFRADAEAHALLDLDTLQHGTLAVELGDALRSWCNPRGEDTLEVQVDVPIFRAAIEGYAGAAEGLVTPEERASLVSGFETIALELASRFCLDAFEERYFRWDPARHESASHHLELRARAQLTLARDVAARRVELDAIVRDAPW
ncbi:MAG: phosphotransferase [Myxococcales bacterium]|nr:phosphotransferase [Myxococcales bacterium]